MIVMPLFGDQYDNAQRVHEKGYGIRLNPHTVSERELLDSIDVLLNDKNLMNRLSMAAMRILKIMDPVQIVELLVTDPDDDTTYILKEKKLNKLCDQLGNRPLAVINVVGKSRTGKSFMLNYLGRYIMKKLQHKIAARSATPLTGFEWNNDSDLVTNGIWFSQPLIVTKESGEELAIILVDTQGLYDKNFPVSDSSAIVGLSLLMSSLLIFNVFSDLEGKTGQRLTNTTRGEGGEGGQQYLESRFQVKRMHTASARSARQNIRNSFDAIDCYLMPERGPAAQGLGFDGRRDMLSPQFIEILDEFCQTVVAPDLLEPKSIGGRPLTGRAFGQYLKIYVNIVTVRVERCARDWKAQGSTGRRNMFNSGQVRACNMSDASYKFADHNLITQIKDEYEAKLVALMADDQQVLSAQDLMAETDALADECRQKFESQKKSVNDRTIRELRDMMAAALTATAKQALDDNERRIQRLKELFVDQTKSYHLDDLELEHTDTVTFVLSQLDQYHTNNHLVPIGQYKSILRDYCRGRYVDYRDKNQTRRQLAEVEARQQLQDLCNQYDLELERLIKLGAGGADTFDEFKAEAKVVGQRVLAEYLEGRHRALSTLNTRDVTARLYELLAESEHVFLEQKRVERISVDQLIDTVLRLYTERMGKRRANTAYVWADRLKQMHDNLVADLIKEHRDRRGHLTDNKFTQLITDLLDTAYCTVSDDNAKNTPTLPAIGIDLGTTNSCVAYYRPDTRQVVVFESDTGRRTTPSVVEYRVEDGEKIVGDTARYNTLSAPRQTVYSVKRLIGRKFSSREVRDDRDNWPFRVVNMGQDEPGVEVETGPGGQTDRFMPEEVSAHVLKKIKETAERGLGGGGDGGQGVVITNCVITVPAYFNDAQRDATKGAATMAGLKVLKIINEPTAVALAYQLNRFDNVRAKTVLIYYFGGGTFDVSLLAIDCGEVNVLAVGGDNHLGGDDVDNLMIAHCMAAFGGEPVDMETDEGSVALRRVKR
ncbi:unnamed protein product [Medioppia subpectinata]|uniref:Guanylate-binding protein N-terminal domain-containing protein n=1 Tax=Medioppia subpectinata TaxID=1979941 RepID=A0A7R9KL02_9ACAR|nr:unnamed protein product [Medioppia subpectinata]CAG2105195.1 unnamed protein product [Medioppia subpectinata]